ncbi:tyrosine-type recombinase/integrase [Gottfriedia sp. NPDC057948]|uniref:tyrosine-type recombinase/integrase n=1 Tax=Gottfriedia sp. NPDC057948 TaxID=3346287 RepID=UPI0036D91886
MNTSNSLKGKRIKTKVNSAKKVTNTANVRQLFEEFMSGMRVEGKAVKTLEQYEYSFNEYERHFGELSLMSFDEAHIRNYADHLLHHHVKHGNNDFVPEKYKKIGLSPTTVRSRINKLRPFINFLYERNYIDKYPFDRMKTIKEEPVDIEVLTADEIKRLLNVIDRNNYNDFRNYVLIHFLLDCFSRIEESLQIRKSDIDFASNSVHLRADTTKSRVSRTLPLKAKTVRLIRELIIENNDFDNEENYIFLSNYGEQLNAKAFRKSLKRYAKLANINKNVRPHILRHSAATMFIAAGGDIAYLRLILGHSDLRMCLRYLHLNNDELKKAHEKYSPLNSIEESVNKSRKRKRSN